MKKFILPALFASLVLSLFFTNCTRKTKPAETTAETTAETGEITISTITEDDMKTIGADKQDGIWASQAMEIERTKEAATGLVPRHRLVEANAMLIADRKKNGLNRANAFTWTERGSTSDAVGPSNGNGRVTTNQVTSGRLRAILVDLSDATNQTVWVGGVDGGVWKTTSISTDPSPWTVATDVTGNIAISDIAQSPADHDIMYFGTGEKTINVDAVRGGGVWKSVDHGVTWTLLNSTINFWNISNVVCDPTNPNTVYISGIGNGVGVRRSTDGGNTWTTITPAGLSNRVTRMEISSTGRLHVVCGYMDGVTGDPDPISGYRYTDNPSTVTSATWTTPTTTFYTGNQINADIAVVGNTLYGLPVNGTYNTPTVWKSTDGGANWSSLAPTLLTSGNLGVSSGQGWYNLAIGADPTNPDNVMVGGLNSYRSTNGGNSWALNSVWVSGLGGGSPAEYIHADHHIIKWNNNQVLDGGDGGLFYSANDGVNWSDRNVGIRLKQFYSVAIHPNTTNYMLGGTQDNGCHQLNGAGLTTSVEVTGGDGGFMHIDQDEPQYQFGAYVFANFRRSLNGGSSWTQHNFGNGGQFINPTDYDDLLNTLYFGWNAGTYGRWVNPEIGGTVQSVTVPAFGSGSVRNIMTSPYTPDRAFFGTGGGTTRVVRIDGASSSAPVATNITGSGMPGAPNSISCVAIGTNDDNLLVTYSNYGLSTNRVWVSTVGGGSGGWTNITGNLPDIPVRWAMFYPDDNTKAILATDLGIFETALINGSSTVWVQDPNLPTVRVDMLQYRKSDGLLAAATHGRGIWTANIPLTQPYIRYAFNINQKNEVTSSTTGCRRYMDYTVNMNVDMAPTGAATVTLTPGGGAIQGVDYDFTTNGNFTTPSNTITFPDGSTTQRSFTIRIYNDSEVESKETFTLTAGVSGATNALIAPSGSIYTFDIVDNEVAPDAGTNPVANTAGMSQTEHVATNGTYYFYNGLNIISELSDASAPLGCVQSRLFENGSTWQAFNGGFRSQKVFDINPAQNPTASYTVSLYFSNAQLGGFPSAGLTIAKTTAAFMEDADATNTVVAPTSVTPYGTGFIFTASFTGFSKFFLINDDVVLPVGLLSFDGILNNDRINLSWSTSMESGSSHFEVEKSYDGSQFFLLGNVAAAGNSTTTRNYGYTDKQVAEQNYYRLRMVDGDGRFTYSHTVLIKAPGVAQDVRVVNNPFNQYIDLRFSKLPVKNVQVDLLDAGGALLLRKQIAPAWQTRFDVSGRTLPSGTYLLRVIADGKQYVRKVIKM